MGDDKAMADPTEVQTALGFGQGVSGGPGITQSFSRSEDGGWCETVVSYRTYLQAIGPGTEYQGSRIDTNYENKLCFSYDWGASIVPFNHIRAACTPEHTEPYMARANSLRLYIVSI